MLLLIVGFCSLNIYNCDQLSNFYLMSRFKLGKVLTFLWTSVFEYSISNKFINNLVDIKYIRNEIAFNMMECLL